MFKNLSEKFKSLKVMKSIENKEEKSAISQKKEYIGLNVKITRTFHKMVKRQALEEDTTVADIVIKALTAYIENKKV
jgi:predicted HicB family RNase H-like nuclease